MDRTLGLRIDAIYGEDDAEAGRVTELLINALREGDFRSRAALGEYLDLEPVTQEELDAARPDLALIQQARSFIDKTCAHRVETWILLYRTSATQSRRSLYEELLRTFVESSSLINT